METNIKRISLTSDGKRKSNQITLRNLLPDDFMLQNNFKSLQTERAKSSVRHQTTYCDRLRKRLYPETANIQKKGIQLHFVTSRQQNRLTRNKSQNMRHTFQLTERQSSPSNYQRSRPLFVSKQQKLRMKKLLGKINLLARRQLQLNDQEEAQTIFNFLECLASNDNFYQQGFKYISDKLKEMIFMSKQHLTNSEGLNLRKVSQITQNKVIISSVYASNEDPVTYKQLLHEYIKEIILTEQKSHKSEGQNIVKMQEMKNLLSQKQDLILKLTRKLNYFQQHPSQNKYPQIMRLKQENQLLKKQMEEEIYKVRVLNHNLEILHETKLMLENKIQELRRAIVNYELEKQSSVDKVQKSSELKIFEDNIKMLKQMLDRSILRMGGMKQEYDKLKGYNQTLVEERDRLAVRAAVGFGELTPRPNLKKILEKHNMNFNDVFNIQQASNQSKKSQKKTISTENFVDTLLGKFKNYYETYKVQQKQRLSSFQLDKLQANKRKRKIPKQKQKQKDVFETALQQVNQAKMQIKKTMQSVQEVKQAYNKKQQTLLKK